MCRVGGAVCRVGGAVCRVGGAVQGERSCAGWAGLCAGWAGAVVIHALFKVGVCCVLLTPTGCLCAVLGGRTN